MRAVKPYQSNAKCDEKQSKNGCGVRFTFQRSLLSDQNAQQMKYIVNADTLLFKRTNDLCFFGITIPLPQLCRRQLEQVWIQRWREIETERDRDGERQRRREIEMKRDRDRKRQRWREIETERQRPKEIEMERDRDREIEMERDRDEERQRRREIETEKTHERQRGRNRWIVQ